MRLAASREHIAEVLHAACLRYITPDLPRPGWKPTADFLAMADAMLPLLAAARRQAVEECAAAADRFAENYPCAVFSAPDSQELARIAEHEQLRHLSDRLGADMARRTSANIATMLRDLYAH